MNFTGEDPTGLQQSDSAGSSKHRQVPQVLDRHQRWPAKGEPDASPNKNTVQVETLVRV